MTGPSGRGVGHLFSTDTGNLKHEQTAGERCPSSIRYDYSPSQSTRVTLVTNNWVPHALRSVPSSELPQESLRGCCRAGPRVHSARPALTQGAARPSPDPPGARPPRRLSSRQQDTRKLNLSAGKARLLGHFLCRAPAPRGHVSVLTTPQTAMSSHWKNDQRSH